MLDLPGHDIPERGDAHWLDHRGSFMAAIAAQPVYHLLGARDLGRSDDDRGEKMPAVNVDRLDGTLAWRQHNGGPDVEHFIRWAAARWGDGKPSDDRSPKEAAADHQAPGAAHAPVERRDPNSRLAHQQLVAKTKQGTIDVYFEGDSITRRWGATDYPRFLAHWRKQFRGWNAANFGWGGDTTHNILWRLQDGEFDGVSPRVIVLQAGTNNLPWVGPPRDTTVDDVVGGIKAIVATFREKAPSATIVLTALFPRPQNKELAPAIRQINEDLARLADGKKVRFVDINDKLTDVSGELLPGVSGDGVHLEEKGYDAWAAALKPILAELLGPPSQIDHSPPPTGDPGAATRDRTGPDGRG